MPLTLRDGRAPPFNAIRANRRPVAQRRRAPPIVRSSRRPRRSGPTIRASPACSSPGPQGAHNTRSRLHDIRSFEKAAQMPATVGIARKTQHGCRFRSEGLRSPAKRSVNGAPPTMQPKNRGVVPQGRTRTSSLFSPSTSHSEVPPIPTLYRGGDPKRRFEPRPCSLAGLPFNHNPRTRSDCSSSLWGGSHHRGGVVYGSVAGVGFAAGPTCWICLTPLYLAVPRQGLRVRFCAALALLCLLAFLYPWGGSTLGDHSSYQPGTL